MACYSPISAFQTTEGQIVFSERGSIARALKLPCQQCVGCRLERSRQWATRCLLESQMHSHNCFITLTYSPEHLPQDCSLDYSHFQLFMKRLRKHFTGVRIRFYMCGEYGENYGRPHYHACLFGLDFSDKSFWKLSPSGEKLYRSAVLESLWPYGFSSVGDVTFQSAAYVARYIMKKITGQPAIAHYAVVDPDTGEYFQRTPEFNKMSLKPGIGALWFEKYSSDVYPHDFIVINGKKIRPPKYFDKLLADDNPFTFDDIQYSRELNADKHLDDNTESRLAVKQAVTNARLSKLKRGFS